MKPSVGPRKVLARAPNSLPENRKDKLRLDMNESALGCSPRVLAALRRLDADSLAMYPEKEAAIEKMAPLFGVHPAEMLLTNGIDDALRLIGDAFLERGRSVLLVEPTFPLYRFYAEQRDSRVLCLRYDSEMRFPLESVLTALRSGPTAFFLANPNNPTGTLLEEGALKKILNAAGRTLVVVDEAYFEFAGLTVLPWIRRHRNLIVTRTFSKVTALAGLRLGCVFAHRSLADVLRRTESPFPVNVAALVAGEASLRDRAFMRRSAREIIVNREILERGLKRIGAKVTPSAANFVLADFGARAAKIIKWLKNDGILVRDCERWIGRPGFVRITVGTKAQIERLLCAAERCA